MKTIFSIIVLALIVTAVNAIGCDTNDPICVASIVFEKGASLRYNELKGYYCKQNEIFLVEAIKRSEERIIELKNKKDIDHYKQVKNDFSRLKYTLLEKGKEKAKVRVSGIFTYDLEGTSFHHEAKVDESIDLIYQDGRWLFCSDELAKRSEVLNRANKSMQRTGK